MQSQKLDVQLNLALQTPPEERIKSENLNVGYDSALQEWELIIRFLGDISFLEQEFAATVTVLLGGYAIVRIKEQYIESMIAREEIIYVEKPNNIFVNVTEAMQVSCITRVTQPDYNLSGNGVLVAIIDSGIDYAHPDFRQEDNTTRIHAIWDQTAIPRNNEHAPEGYIRGVLYSREQINEALQAQTRAEQLMLVPQVDLSGHGTFVAGVAAGNGRASNGRYQGAAPKSELLVVKLGNPQEKGFPRTTELMLAIDYVVKEANSRNMPVAINLSFGNNYGSHDGTSLLESFIDVAENSGQVVVCIGSGNEGDTGRHTSVLLQNTIAKNISFNVAPSEHSLNIQIWKNYVDTFDIYLISPNESQIGPLIPELGVARYELMGTQIDIYYGMPKPYQKAQEIFIDMVPKQTNIASGEWKLRLVSRQIVDGKVDIWLPVSGATNRNTRFLLPAVDTSLTIPGTANSGITVGAYDSRTDAVAPFSGRGFTRVNDIKPDLVAPGVEITSCAVGGGYTVKSGTSMATPFVTGSAALLMEWGIIKEHDRYLYGQKVKAYLQKGARKLPGFAQWPNALAGWGALCLADSFPSR